MSLSPCLFEYQNLSLDELILRRLGHFIKTSDQVNFEFRAQINSPERLQIEANLLNRLLFNLFGAFFYENRSARVFLTTQSNQKHFVLSLSCTDSGFPPLFKGLNHPASQSSPYWNSVSQLARESGALISFSKQDNAAVQLRIPLLSPTEEKSLLNGGFFYS